MPTRYFAQLLPLECLAGAHQAPARTVSVSRWWGRAAALLALATMLVLSGCASTGPAQAELTSARAAVTAASNDPYAARSAAVELDRARRLLAQAEASWQGGRDTDQTRHLSYMAQRGAEIAMAMGERARHEEALQGASAERDRIRLDARTREAQAAAQRAQAAGSVAQQARTDASAARTDADAARTEADAAQARAAALARDLQALQARNTARGLVVTLGDVLFATGSATLFPGAQRSVDQLGQVLRQYGERRVLIEGFTDTVGSASSNELLSQRRAESVRNALVNQGIDSQRVQVRGYGEAYPVASNTTAAGRQQNRRVEVVFSDQQGGFAPR